MKSGSKECFISLASGVVSALVQITLKTHTALTPRWGRVFQYLNTHSHKHTWTIPKTYGYTLTSTWKPFPAHGHTSHILVSNAQKCQLGTLHKQQYLFSVRFSCYCVSKCIPSSFSCHCHCMSVNVFSSTCGWMNNWLPWLCHWLLALWRPLEKWNKRKPNQTKRK